MGPARLLLVVLGVALLAACGARPLTPEDMESEKGWVAVRGVPSIEQEGMDDCGDTAAAMVLRHWGEAAEPEAIRAAAGASGGLRADFLRDHLRARGLKAFLIEGTVQDLEREVAAGRPVLIGVAKPGLRDAVAHYLVVVGVNRPRHEVLVIDPAEGWRAYGFKPFLEAWLPTHSLMIAASR